MKKLFKKMSKEGNFWSWFSNNSDRFFHFENNQNRLFAELRAQLQKLNPRLVFEFSPILNDGTRELVISADGNKSIFPVVKSLVAKAPHLENWKFIAFRQKRANMSKIQIEDLIINLDDVFFRYAKDNGKIALELNIKGVNESKKWTAAIFIILDSILGEYDTEMFVGRIDRRDLDQQEINDLLPIRALPKIIQDYRLEFRN